MPDLHDEDEFIDMAECLICDTPTETPLKDVPEYSGVLCKECSKAFSKET